MTPHQRRPARAGSSPWASAAALAMLLAALPAAAGDNIYELRLNDRGQAIALVPLRWRTLPVRWRVHASGVVNNLNNGNTVSISVDQARAEIEKAFLGEPASGGAPAIPGWASIAGSGVRAVFDLECLYTPDPDAVQCQDGKTSTAARGLDGENVFTWSDPIAAVGSTSYFALQRDHLVTDDPGTRDLNGDGQMDLHPDLYLSGTLLPAGTIVDSDVAFNSVDLDWVSTPTSHGDIADIRSVALHEQGHWLGLAHSPLWGPLSVMFPFVDLFSAERQLDQRLLKTDDMASARRFYPDEPALSGAFGAITGRLMTAGGAAVVGEPVAAFDALTLQAAGVDFTAHPLSEGSAGGGAFALEGLPPGDYLVQVGTFDGTQVYHDRNRYSYETINGASVGQRPAFAVEPGSESAADDFLPPRRLRVAAGARLDAGAIIANTDTPSLAPLAGAVPLGLGDNEAVLIDLETVAGFQFPFYGTSYRQLFVYDNGYVTFTNATSPAPEPIAELQGTDYAAERLDLDFLTRSPKVGVLFRNHDPTVDDRGPNTGEIDVYRQAQLGGSVSFIWAAAPEVVLSSNLVDSPGRADTFTLTLYATGVIEIGYGSLGTSYGIAGITPGGEGAVHREVDLSSAALFQAGPGDAIAEEFWVGKPDFTVGVPRFFDGLDLGGGSVRFVPGADPTAYAVVRPDLRPPEISAPGSGQPLMASGPAVTLLTWEPGAPLFNLYRGLLSGLASSGVYTPDGSCLATDLPEARYEDAIAPAPGQGYYYLVSGVSAAGAEGTLGFASSGAERLNTSPCP